MSEEIVRDSQCLVDMEILREGEDMRIQLEALRNKHEKMVANK